MFALKSNEELVSINSGKGSNINVADALLVFVNDILQVPGEGYQFKGGSLITFTEAPKVVTLVRFSSIEELDQLMLVKLIF